jgi:hypothetical protein
MNSTLYEIGDDLRALANLMDECDAELTPEVDAALSAWFAELSGNEAAKLDAYVNLIRIKKMEAAQAREEAEQYLMKARSRENAQGRLEQRLKGYLEYTGRKKIETATKRVIAIQANGGSTPIRIADNLDVNTVPDDLVVVRRTVNLDAVRDVLKGGAVLDWATLGERGTHLRIR